eukprot:376864_1
MRSTDILLANVEVEGNDHIIREVSEYESFQLPSSYTHYQSIGEKSLGVDDDEPWQRYSSLDVILAAQELNFGHIEHAKNKQSKHVSYKHWICLIAAIVLIIVIVIVIICVA